MKILTAIVLAIAVTGCGTIGGAVSGAGEDLSKAGEWIRNRWKADMKQQKFACIDCKHAFNGVPFMTSVARVLKIDFGWKCGHAQSFKQGRFDAITGRTAKPDYDHCFIRRMTGEGCGPEASQWVPVNRRDIFKLITKDQA